MFTPIASRLLANLETAHEALGHQATASPTLRRALRAVLEAIASALTDVHDEVLTLAPAPDEWSMAEVVEHMAEHDRAYLELASLGLAHYVEHGLEHALQLWKLRGFHDREAATVGDNN